MINHHINIKSHRVIYWRPIKSSKSRLYHWSQNLATSSILATHNHLWFGSLSTNVDDLHWSETWNLLMNYKSSFYRLSHVAQVGILLFVDGTSWLDHRIDIFHRLCVFFPMQLRGSQNVGTTRIQKRWATDLRNRANGARRWPRSVQPPSSTSRLQQWCALKPPGFGFVVGTHLEGYNGREMNRQT